MRFRIGLVLGFATGYWFGTAAGRERHEQLRNLVSKVRRSDAYETATEKAKAAVDLTVERTKEFVEEHKPGNGRLPDDLVTPNGPQVRI